MATKAEFRLETDPEKLLCCFEQIKTLANAERDGLGFIPEQGMRDAISRCNLMALMDDHADEPIVAGYIFHSGVYPNAKIQQITAAPAYRRIGVASSLVRRLASDLEAAGYMSIRADVASDLPAALAFYAKNDFLPITTRAGGKTRNRSIIQHVRDLEVDTLFSRIDRPLAAVEGAFRSRRSWEAQSFALDLNVYFDLARERKFSMEARQLFSSALAHEVRVVVADEFVRELAQTSRDRTNDPVLQLALRLPRLPAVSSKELEHLRTKIHDLVFVASGSPDAGTSQAKSDAGHLAHAALSRVSAFVTRDGTILNARDSLIHRFGIDVLSTQEMTSLLPAEQRTDTSVPKRGSGFVCEDAEFDEVARYLSSNNLPSALVDEFNVRGAPNINLSRKIIRQGGEVAACGLKIEPRSTQPICRLLVHTRPEALDAELFVDHLVDVLLRAASSRAALSIEVECVPGQTSLSGVLRSRFFSRSSVTSSYQKVVLGRPVTPSNWRVVVQELRRRTSVILPSDMPSENDEFQVGYGDVGSVTTSLGGLEDLLGPTMVMWPSRLGVVVPITRLFSERLLGGGDQRSLPLEDDMDASFFSRRSYVNAPRTARRMRPQAPIFFYESMGGGGRGAIVACARITDVRLMCKQDIPGDARRRVVVEDVGSLSSTNDVLVTTFDNLLMFPVPVKIDVLRKVGAVSRSNFVTATEVSGENMARIIEKGWTDERC
ncbi:MAG: GNAT family N-acetyltransferase [Pseudomonadota bacterium]